MSDEPKATRVGDGVYRVEHAGMSELVYIAGSADRPWVFWNGHVYHGPFEEASPAPDVRIQAQQSIAAPMPAKVLRLLVDIGALVTAGQTLIVLEAMKMELPLRAVSDATVAMVHCREGDMVQAGAVLVDLR